MEIQMTYRGITFNDSTDINTGVFMLQNIPEGLRHPTIRQSEFNKQNRHGIFDNPSYYGVRTITLQGKVIGATQALRKTLEEQLRNVFQLDGNQTGTEPSYYDLFLTDEDGVEKQMKVKVSRGIEFSKEAQLPEVRDFIVELKTKDTAWLSQTLYSESVTEGVLTSSFILPTLLPIALGETFINEETLVNGGNFSSFPVITLTGIGNNPSIYNTTTGERLTLSIDIDTGDTVVIDCANGTITKNGVDALFSLDTDAQFISLAPGNNLIRLSDDSPETEALQALFEWRYAWL